MARLTFAFRQRRSLAQVIGRKDPAIKRAARLAVADSGERMFTDAKRTCPVGVTYTRPNGSIHYAGTMRDLLRLRFTPAGYAYDVGWVQRDFESQGDFFYPPVVVHGSRSGSRPNPFLELAWQRERPRFNQGVTRALNQAVRRG